MTCNAIEFKIYKTISPPNLGRIPARFKIDTI